MGPRSLLLVALSVSWVFVAGSNASCGGGGGGSPDGAVADTSGDSAPTVDPCAADVSGVSTSTSISAAWANEGGDKVTQDELRATGHASAVTNSAWDGKCIRVFGAQNE